MDNKEIDIIINSQKEFNKTNSNSVNYRIQILNSLLKEIIKTEDKIYEALKKDLINMNLNHFYLKFFLLKEKLNYSQEN